MGWRELMRTGTDVQPLKSNKSINSKTPPKDIENRDIAIFADNALRVSTTDLDDEITPIFSKILNETVCFVAHNDRERAKHLDTGATYFLDELTALVDANPSPDELRLIHKAKRDFNGTIAEDMVAT